MAFISKHPEAKIIRIQLRQNLVLRHLDDEQWTELEPLLEIEDYAKSEALELQGGLAMEQYFIIEGILKRVVSNSLGKEMILRFAAESDIDTSYAAWRLGTPIPYSIRTVTKARTVKLAMPQWGHFLEHHPKIKQEFEFEVMRLMADVMAHTITLHLLDAPGRVRRFMRKHPELVDRLPKKELASYLNLSPETLSRLKRRGKVQFGSSLPARAARHTGVTGTAAEIVGEHR